MSEGTGEALRFAAAPVFAVMGLATALGGGDPSPLCSAAPPHGLNGMALMYALMSAVHLAPWLGRVARRRCAS